MRRELSNVECGIQNMGYRTYEMWNTGYWICNNSIYGVEYGTRDVEYCAGTMRMEQRGVEYKMRGVWMQNVECGIRSVKRGISIDRYGICNTMCDYI